MSFKNILVTGPPGCGKSTLLEKVIEQLKQPLSGFITRETREKGKRVGFSIETLDGKKSVLAHIRSASPYKVGRYGVSIEIIDRLVVPSLKIADPGGIIIVDEIGKMECLSASFRSAVSNILDSPGLVLGSISQRGGPFIQSIREREDVLLIDITPANRDLLVDSILEMARHAS